MAGRPGPGKARLAGAVNNMTGLKLVLEREALSVTATVTQPTDLIANPDTVILELRAKTGEEAIRELHDALGSAAGGVSDEPALLAELLARAALASVCIAPEVALPHARTAAVGRLVLAVGRSASGIAFDAEHPAVRLVFLIGTPKDAVTDYLKLVAALSRLLRAPVVRRGLITAKTEWEFLTLLRETMNQKR
ncbi:MAG: PTS sugar transporter subunit IIA [Verrucomicrobia bacterium]|nr:PTS sugar transporter subunit IIA [Verrucomicrobiota bacterium]